MCRVELGGPAAWSPDGRRIAGFRDRRLAVVDLASGRSTTLALPRHVFVRQIAWADAGTVLLAVTDVSGDQGAVLRCRPGGRCRQAPLGALTQSPMLVLAR
jgi:hypothetical protein